MIEQIKKRALKRDYNKIHEETVAGYAKLDEEQAAEK